MTEWAVEEVVHGMIVHAACGQTFGLARLYIPLLGGTCMCMTVQCL